MERRNRAVVLLRVVWLPALVCGLLALSAVDLVPRLTHSECEMTWMFSWPQYQRLNLSHDLRRSFPQYSLHLYRETRRREEPLLDSAPLRLSGLPVLFIPGNAGSHKQVRSSASIALQMQQREFSSSLHFDFFTVNLNEELSGVFGGVLSRQTKFVAACVRHILSLYHYTRPTSVLIIAHSMGGVVAEALFTLPEFPPSLVTTIITLSSPLSRPVVTFDPTILDFYHNISEVWSDDERGVVRNVTLVSVSGDYSDVQVPFHLTVPPFHHNPCIGSSSIPRNWVPADHRAIVWCRRVQLALSRALFLLQSPPTNQLTSDPSRRQEVLHHLLFRGWSVPMETSNTRLSTNRWKMVEALPYYQESFPPSITALPLSPSSFSSSSLLVASNSAGTHWVYVCVHPSPATTGRANCFDLSTLTHILPPREKVVKYVSLVRSDLVEGATHVVVVQPPRVKEEEGGGGREFVLMEWCGEKTYSLNLPFWGSVSLNLPPLSHCALTTIHLPTLTHMWSAHSVLVTSSCVGVKGGLVLPRKPHTPLLHDNGTGTLTIPLSLQVPVPDGSAELLVWSPSNCSVSLSISPSLLPLASKLLVLYTPLLLPWVTAVAMVSPGQHNLMLEMVVLAVMWGATSVGLPGGTDWERLTNDGLWPLWGPLLLHLVAHGLSQILRAALLLPSRLLGNCRCFHGCFRGDHWVVFGVLVALVCGLGLSVCGAAGLLCVLVSYSLKATDEQKQYVQRLLFCLFVLSLPSLLSWLKDIRFALHLSPDPLFWPVGVASVSSLLFLLFPNHHLRLDGGCGFTSMPSHYHRYPQPPYSHSPSSSMAPFTPTVSHTL